MEFGGILAPTTFKGLIQDPGLEGSITSRDNISYSVYACTVVVGLSV